MGGTPGTTSHCTGRKAALPQPPPGQAALLAGLQPHSPQRWLCPELPLPLLLPLPWPAAQRVSSVLDSIFVAQPVPLMRQGKQTGGQLRKESGQARGVGWGGVGVGVGMGAWSCPPPHASSMTLGTYQTTCVSLEAGDWGEGQGPQGSPPAQPREDSPKLVLATSP